MMDNHVHLCLRDDGEDIDALGRAMQYVQTNYAKKFNAKTNHVGHVFQGRFTSSPIEDERYLLETVRYIHKNPEYAGICGAGEYRWSSYREYVGDASMCDTGPILETLGGRAGFADFIASSPQKAFIAPAERRSRISDEEAVALAKEILPGSDLGDLKGLPRQERDKALVLLKSEGISVRQLERLTGIGRNVIARATGK